jgi:hypothetical protein
MDDIETPETPETLETAETDPPQPPQPPADDLWPEPVDGNWLATEMVGSFPRYLSLCDGVAEASAFYCKYTPPFAVAGL